MSAQTVADPRFEKIRRGICWDTAEAVADALAALESLAADLARHTEALRQWECIFCWTGVGYHRGWPDFEKTCNTCGGTALNPIAADALGEVRS